MIIAYVSYHSHEIKDLFMFDSATNLHGLAATWNNLPSTPHFKSITITPNYRNRPVLKTYFLQHFVL